MSLTHLTHEQHAAVVAAGRHPFVMRRTPAGVLVDFAAPPAWVPPRSLLTPAATLDDATRTKLDAARRLPWPARGSLLWALMHGHATGSQALVDAVTQLVVDGGCTCRSHWAAYLRQHPPTFGVGWRPWAWDAHNAVNRLRGVAEMPWAESEGGGSTTR